MATKLSYTDHGNFLNLSGNYGNSFEIDYPTTVKKGDLLVAVMFGDASAISYTTKNGWSLIANNNPDSVALKYAVYTRGAIGTEGGTTETFGTTISLSSSRVGVMYRFGGSDGAGHVTGDIYGTTKTALDTSDHNAQIATSNNNPDNADALAIQLNIAKNQYTYIYTYGGYEEQEAASVGVYFGGFEVATQAVDDNDSDGYVNWNNSGALALQVSFFAWATDGQGVRNRMINIT